MLEHLIEDLAKGLGMWAYVLVGGLALAETAAFLGFIAPGEFAVILGGVLAGEGELSIELLIGIVWACAVAGDSIGYMIGHRFGRGFALKYGPRVRLTEDRLKRVEEYFAKHGGKTIILGRWLGFVRPLMPFTAGSSGMPYRRFLPYDVVSAGVWTATFCLLGYFFWHSFTTITSIASRGALVLRGAGRNGVRDLSGGPPPAHARAAPAVRGLGRKAVAKARVAAVRGGRASAVDGAAAPALAVRASARVARDRAAASGSRSRGSHPASSGSSSPRCSRWQPSRSTRSCCRST